MQQMFRLLIFLIQPYMFRATNSPILRSTFWLYIQLLLQGTNIRLVVFKSVSWYSNPSRGIQIRLVLFKSVSWYSNPSRDIQIHLVVFKFVLWYSNSSRSIQIRLVVFKFVFVVFKFVWRVRLTALGCLVGNCCWFSMSIVIFPCALL